jgi:hypothetical protein
MARAAALIAGLLLTSAALSLERGEATPAASDQSSPPTWAET